MCFGRGRSEGVTFSAASDISAQPNVSACVQQTETAFLNTNFDWNSQLTAAATNASIVQGRLELANSAVWR
jgi:hypothetical protein